RVVVYDDNFGKDAVRIWWILRYWGVKDVRVLNGGWRAWKAAGGEVTDESHKPVPAPARLLTPQSDRLTTKSQLLESLKKEDFQIVDTRSEGEYCGIDKKARRNGAIPGAKHLEWIDLLDKKTQKFKSADELKKLFADAGIDLK